MKTSSIYVMGYEIRSIEKALSSDAPPSVSLHRMGGEAATHFTPEEARRFGEAMTHFTPEEARRFGEAMLRAAKDAEGPR
jgi:hypothetical protein